MLICCSFPDSVKDVIAGELSRRSCKADEDQVRHLLLWIHSHLLQSKRNFPTRVDLICNCRTQQSQPTRSWTPSWSRPNLQWWRMAIKLDWTGWGYVLLASFLPLWPCFHRYYCGNDPGALHLVQGPASNRYSTWTRNFLSYSNSTRTKHYSDWVVRSMNTRYFWTIAESMFFL